MKQEPTSLVLRYLRTMIPPTGAAEGSDAQLLEQFSAARDEAAFAALVHRHGPLVWGVCRRLLRHHEDAEDAFQATFLVLARKAGAIRRPDLLANWLYGVACRTAARARVDAARRQARERAAAVPVMIPPPADILWRDVRPILDEEIQRLPAKYRMPFILCYLEGRTNEEAARQIGCPKGTVLSRLAWARQWLRQRLERRGVTLAVGGVVAFLEQQAAPATVSARLVETTMGTVLAQATGKSVAGAIIASGPAALAQGVINHMILTQLKVATAVVLLIGTIGVGALTYAGQGGKSETTSATPPEPRHEGLTPPVEKSPDAQLARLQLEAAIKDIIQVQADIRRAKVEIALAQANQKKTARQTVTDSEIEQWVNQDPSIQEDVHKIADLRAHLNEIEPVLRGGRDNPIYKRELALLGELNKELATRRGKLRPVAEDYLRDQRTAKVRSKLDVLQNRLAPLQELEKVLDADIRRLSQKIRSSEPSTEERLRAMEKEIKEIKAAVEALKKK